MTLVSPSVSLQSKANDAARFAHLGLLFLSVLKNSIAATALELLETAVLAQKPFEQIVEPIARSFDESGMSEEELDDLVEQTQKSIRQERRRNK